MRRGELLGPRWDDIDLEGHRIFVRRALWRRKFVTPKSRRSRRTIDVAPTPRAALAMLSSRFQGGLILGNTDGSPVDPDNFAHRDWARVLRRAGVRRIRFHDLRHTYASLLFAQGAHPKYIQAQLSHASIQTTLDRYGHLMPEAHAAEARSSVAHEGGRGQPGEPTGVDQGHGLEHPVGPVEPDVGELGQLVPDPGRARSRTGRTPGTAPTARRRYG
jgi:hypothetical protein